MRRQKAVTLTRGVEDMALVIEALDDFCQGIGISSQDEHSLHLAVEEIVSNVLVHGYRGLPHPVSVSLESIPPDRVRAVVTDSAPAYDPLSRPEVDTTQPLEERPIGGLGVHLVKKLMDATHYERRDGQNILTMELILDRKD